jgi:hypothetical protein
LGDGFLCCALVFFDDLAAVSNCGIFPCSLLFICSILPEGFVAVFLQVVDIFL